jgi:hypothetical protein
LLEYPVRPTCRSQHPALLGPLLRLEQAL